MRLLLLVACIGLLTCPCLADESGIASAPPARGEAPATGEAYVAVKVALARSGPGQNHYPTDPLTKGERVEILDIKDSWVAIRAPDDSFSWVPGDQLKMLAGGRRAEVIAEDVYCWVGSNVEEVAQHDYQVRLRRGEQLEVLGTKEVASADGTTSTWVKVKPPAGERRWVRVDELTRVPPPKLEPTRDASEERRAAAGNASGSAKGDSSADSGWLDRNSRSSARPRSTTTAARADAPARRPSRSAGELAADKDFTAILDIPADATFEDALTRLQLALSRIAATGPTVEQLERLEQRTIALVRQGKTTYERGQAALLLESIEQFRALAVRREAAVELASFAPEGSAEPTANAARGAGDSEKEASNGDASPYLAEGWLMPVSSPKRNAPPFVLMDDEGHPIAFVTPAPGLNINRYRNQPVGIIGQNSFRVFDRAHVVAHRVVKLDRGQPPAQLSGAPWIRYR